MRAALVFGKKGALLLLALGLTACGGGDGGTTNCVSGIAGLCQSLGTRTPTTPGTPPPTTPPLTMLTATINTSDCTSNIPFIFSGGVGPYTVLTSDFTLVPVSAPLPLGSKWYFLATIRSLWDSPDSDIGGIKHWDLPRRATVTVLDSAAQSVATKIEIASVHECPKNPLLTLSPTSANAHATEIIKVFITGGKAPFSVVSSDPDVVTVPDGELPRTDFNAQATASNRTTTEAALLTVSSADGQKANITFTVLPLP